MKLLSVTRRHRLTSGCNVELLLFIPLDFEIPRESFRGIILIKLISPREILEIVSSIYDTRYIISHETGTIICIIERNGAASWQSPHFISTPSHSRPSRSRNWGNVRFLRLGAFMSLHFQTMTREARRKKQNCERTTRRAFIIPPSSSFFCASDFVRARRLYSSVLSRKSEPFQGTQLRRMPSSFSPGIVGNFRARDNACSHDD